MFNAEFSMTAAMERGMKTAMADFAKQCVAALAEKYEFDVDEGVTFLGLDAIKRATTKKTGGKKQDGGDRAAEKKSKPVKPAFPLPWCGKVRDECCKAIRNHSSMFTQCPNAPEGESRFCKTCDGKLKFGTVDERMAAGADWTHTKENGKVVKPASFGNLFLKLEKKGVTKEQVREEAAKFGFELPEGCFSLAKRGRPSGSEKERNSASDTDASGGASGAPKRSREEVRDAAAAAVAKAQAEVEAEGNRSEAEDALKRAREAEGAKREMKIRRSTQKPNAEDVAARKAAKAARKAAKAAKKAEEKARKEAEAEEQARKEAEAEKRAADAVAEMDALLEAEEEAERQALEDGKGSITIDGEVFVFDAKSGIFSDDAGKPVGFLNQDTGVALWFGEGEESDALFEARADGKACGDSIAYFDFDTMKLESYDDEEDEEE